MFIDILLAKSGSAAGVARVNSDGIFGTRAEQQPLPAGQLLLVGHAVPVELIVDE
jgi:hypothetical protein